MCVPFSFQLKPYWLCGIFLTGWGFFWFGGCSGFLLKVACSSSFSCFTSVKLISLQSFVVYTSPCLCKIGLGEYRAGIASRVL